MYSETIYLTLRYNPVECHYECVEGVHTILHIGTYDQVEAHANKIIESQKGWIDAPIYKIVDKRPIRQDYIPKHPIHPKEKKWHPKTH